MEITKIFLNGATAVSTGLLINSFLQYIIQAVALVMIWAGGRGKQKKKFMKNHCEQGKAGGSAYVKRWPWESDNGTVAGYCFLTKKLLFNVIKAQETNILFQHHAYIPSNPVKSSREIH